MEENSENKDIEENKIKSEKEKNIEKEKLEARGEEAKEEKKEIEKIKEKNEAFVNGRNLPISKKHSMAICRFIKGKEPEKAMEELEGVLKFKKIIPMKGEIPHRKGGISGRYPVNACKVFIKLLKSLSANASVNGMESIYIATAKADRGSRPYRRFGSRRFKRTNILLIARELNLEKNAEKLGK